MTASSSRSSPKVFQVGTLTYSISGVFALFIWLLWGDFCFSLMEVVWNSIIPLKIKELQAPNWVIGAIMVSIPQILNVLLNPVISTASDRCRSRWGRRRPFMLAATPFISAILCLIGFSPNIGQWLHGSGLGNLTGWSVGAVTVAVIAVLIFMFRIAELFVGTVFYYLFNDVVPLQFMARFLALFRVVGTGAGALYSYFVFPHALEHMRLIFVCVGILYFVGFVMMCLMVKEGEYPPPTPLAEKSKGRFAAVRLYFKECLHQKLHVLLYLHLMLWTMASACSVFMVFMNLSLGLTLQNIGTISAAVSVASALLIYPAGVLADRFHPMRLMVWIKFVMVVLTPLNFVWLFTNYSPSINFWILVTLNVIALPMTLIYQATLMPLYMRLFPREQFGQFCSFIAICMASVGVAGGLLGGIFIDAMRKIFPDSLFGADYCYRLIPAWNLFFLGCGLILLALVYKEWIRLGGDSYKAHSDLDSRPD
ncbi:MAG: MFS transporter [Verrucomicrobiota bacterium]